MLIYFKRKKSLVLGLITSICLILTFVACSTLENNAEFTPPKEVNSGIVVEPIKTDNENSTNSVSQDNTGIAQQEIDSKLLEIYLVGETDEGISPWDNENLDVLVPVGEPLITSELLLGYYSNCSMDDYPNLAMYGEIIPGEGNDAGILYYNIEDGCSSLFQKNLENVGGKTEKQYGLLFMSQGEKLMCAVYDSGSELATPSNAQIGITVSNEIVLWGAYGEFNFSEIIASILPANLYFTPEKLKEEYDQLVQSNPLSDMLDSSNTISLYSGSREKIILSKEQIEEIASLLDSAQYNCRTFDMSEEQRQQKSFSVMSLNIGFNNGETHIGLFEDMESLLVMIDGASEWVYFDEAYFNAPEFISYIDDLSQNGKLKLNEIKNITEVKLKQKGEVEKVLIDTDVLNEIEKHLSTCKRMPMDNLHGSDYEIIMIAEGIEYTIKLDDNVKEALIFDGHQYKVPIELLELLYMY